MLISPFSGLLNSAGNFMEELPVNDLKVETLMY